MNEANKLSGQLYNKAAEIANTTEWWTYYQRKELTAEELQKFIDELNTFQAVINELRAKVEKLCC